MKYTILLMLFLIFTVVKSQAQKKPEFDYPEDSTTESSQKAFVKNFKQGKVLYTTVCAQCHTYKEGNKYIIPDFSLPQLMDYEMRIFYPEHQDRMKDTQLTDEELNKVIIFLRYKAKSGKTIQQAPGRPVN